MLRILSILFISLLVLPSCVKPPVKQEIPEGEYKNFVAYQDANGNDHGELTLSYVDGDGDLFVSDQSTQYPNVVFSIYIYNETTKKFKVFINPKEPKDSSQIVAWVKEPADGYYKGKSIKGDITLPLNEFRPPGGFTKIFYYRGYLMDMDGNQSNIITTPTFTLDF